MAEHWRLQVALPPGGGQFRVVPGRVGAGGVLLRGRQALLLSPCPCRVSLHLCRIPAWAVP